MTSSVAGQYTITLTGGSGRNYEFQLLDGVLTITNVSPSIFSIVELGRTNVLIAWSAISGITYRVQYCSAFEESWQDMVPDVTATNGTAFALDNPGSAVQRFYRVTIP